MKELFEMLEQQQQQSSPTSSNSNSSITPSPSARDSPIAEITSILAGFVSEEEKYKKNHDFLAFSSLSSSSSSWAALNGGASGNSAVLQQVLNAHDVHDLKCAVECFEQTFLMKKTKSVKGTVDVSEDGKEEPTEIEAETQKEDVPRSKDPDHNQFNRTNAQIGTEGQTKKHAIKENIQDEVDVQKKHTTKKNIQDEVDVQKKDPTGDLDEEDDTMPSLETFLEQVAQDVPAPSASPHTSTHTDPLQNVDPKILATIIAQCRRFKDPFLAYYLTHRIRSISTPLYVAWFDTHVYNELIYMDWTLHHDLDRLSTLVVEMVENGVLPNNFTMVLLKRVKGDLVSDNDPRWNKKWEMVMRRLADLIPSRATEFRSIVIENVSK